MPVVVGKLYHIKENRRFYLTEKLADNHWQTIKVRGVLTTPSDSLGIEPLKSAVFVVDIAKLTRHKSTWPFSVSPFAEQEECISTKTPIVLWESWYLAVDFCYLVPVQISNLVLP